MMKQRKSTKTLLLLAMIVFSILSISVNAADEGEATLSISDVKAVAGQTVSVNISVDNNPGIAAAFFTLTYNNEAMALTAVELNQEFGGTYTPAPSLNSPVSLTWETSNMSDNMNNGNMFKLTFDISEDSVLGESYDITLNYGAGDVCNLDEDDVDFKINNGTVTIVNPLPGDINCDQAVNAKDLTRMRKYFANWDVEVDSVALDCNGDGSINSKDLTRLRKYFADWDVELYYGTITTTKCKHTSLTAVNAKEASCTVDGNIAYWKCDLCSKYFSNAQATNEVSISDVVIKASGHTYSTGQWSADENEHWHTAICEHTDERKDVAQHIFENDVCKICSYDKSEDTKITVTFVDYDSSVLSTQKISSGESAVEPSSPTRTNYAFVGWDKSFENLITDTVIKAQYIQQFTVTFKDYDGTVLKTQKVNKGQNATPPDSPSSVEGYHFKQWNGSYNNVNSTTTVTATYEINMYNVKFVYPDGTLIKEEEVGYGYSALAPNVEEMYVNWSEKKAYFFNSWDTDYSQVKNNMIVTADYSIPVNEPVIAVYAENGHNLTQGTVASTVYLYFLGDISMYGLDLQFSYNENLKISSEDKIKYADLFENAATKLVDRNKNYQLTWVADTKKEISGFLEIMSIEFSFPALMESGKYFIDISDDTYIVNEKLERVVPTIIPGYVSFK